MRAAARVKRTLPCLARKDTPSATVCSIECVRATGDVGAGLVAAVAVAAVGAIMLCCVVLWWCCVSPAEKESIQGWLWLAELGGCCWVAGINDPSSWPCPHFNSIECRAAKQSRKAEVLVQSRESHVGRVAAGSTRKNAPSAKTPASKKKRAEHSAVAQNGK